MDDDDLPRRRDDVLTALTRQPLDPLSIDELGDRIEILGRAYGSRSPGRIRRLVDYMEKQGVIVVRADFGGRRSIGIPELGLSTEAE